MTKEEAIQVLTVIKGSKEFIQGFGTKYNKDIEAIDLAIENLSADTVPKGLLEQFRWERDVAMMQLEEYGIPFLTNKDEDIVKVVRCGECKHLHADGRCEEFADDGIRPSASDFCSYGERREE